MLGVATEREDSLSFANVAPSLRLRQILPLRRAFAIALRGRSLLPIDLRHAARLYELAIHTTDLPALEPAHATCAKNSFKLFAVNLYTHVRREP